MKKTKQLPTLNIYIYVYNIYIYLFNRHFFPGIRSVYDNSVVSLSYNSTNNSYLPQENDNWDILDSYNGEENVTLNGKTYSNIKVHYKLKRKNSYYLMNVIMPFILTSFAGLFVFVIPSERPEKTSFGVTVLLSECVLLVIVSENIPSISSDTPILCKFFPK